MKNLTKEEIYGRFLVFCEEHPVGLPKSIVVEFDMDSVDQLVREGSLNLYLKNRS